MGRAGAGGSRRRAREGAGPAGCAAEMEARSAQLATAMDKETELEAMINSQRVHTDQALQELEGRQPHQRVLGGADARYFASRFN